MNVRTNLKDSALYLACQEGHPEVVQLLLDAGADVRGLQLPLGGWAGPNIGIFNPESQPAKTIRACPYGTCACMASSWPARVGGVLLSSLSGLQATSNWHSSHSPQPTELPHAQINITTNDGATVLTAAAAGGSTGGCEADCMLCGP